MNSSKKNPSSLIIAGTDYDRRRKVTQKMASKMKKMVAAGKSTSNIADTLGVSPWAVKYNTNKKFRASEIIRKTENPTGGHGETTQADRNAYKAQLIKSRRKIEKWVK